ncbi:MAG TPA: hypothetical protein PLW93_03400 [Candidatus Absconditabacterales bacterium]|nr:hypothetical protein [Candidatus Absconditabacterales bacterium]HNG97294.1 hypothetical protein [Candidatus Absconditabacterales bacterium]
MKTLRFKRKLYGRGWSPASWQGRMVLILYILMIGGRIVIYDSMANKELQQYTGTNLESNAGGNLVVLLLPIAVLTIILIIVCTYTGETPKRQWGNQNNTTK